MCFFKEGVGFFRRYMNNRDTVGKLAVELNKKEAPTRDPIALEREMHKEYEKNVYECIERGKKEIPSSDFYVVVETKKEKLLPNVIRNYFFFRQSCPTPTTDQTVYRYHAQKDFIEFLWVIPSEDTCELLRDNALTVSKEEQLLLFYVLDFYDGTLLKMAKQLNNEQADSVLLASS